MKCDRCGKKKAEINFVEVTKDGTRIIHLCKDCAREMGILKPHIDEEKKEIDENFIPQCPVCGLTFEEFEDTHLFGCITCYTAFRPKLYTIFKKIQGSEYYKGTGITQNERILTIKKNLRILRKKLEQYVEDEKYEDAIKIRNKIEKFEKELKTNGS